MFIDIHCHLDLFKKEEIEGIVERAKKKKVGVILNTSTNPETDKEVLEISKIYSEVKSSLGCYPVDCLKLSEDEINDEINFIKKNKTKIIAIGEVGLDLKEVGEIEKQKNNLKKFIKLSKEIDKPLIIHSRYAEKEAIELLEKEGAKKVLMHCFNGNLKLVKKVIENGWYLSIPTIVTYVEHFSKIIEICPIEQLFCETDSPFLHPVKGQRNNEPANVIESYKKIAEIKRLSLNEVERQIEENFLKLFN